MVCLSDLGSIHATYKRYLKPNFRSPFNKPKNPSFLFPILTFPATVLLPPPTCHGRCRRRLCRGHCTTLTKLYSFHEWPSTAVPPPRPQACPLAVAGTGRRESGGATPPPLPPRRISGQAAIFVRVECDDSGQVSQRIPWRRRRTICCNALIWTAARWLHLPLPSQIVRESTFGDSDACPDDC